MTPSLVKVCDEEITVHGWDAAPLPVHLDLLPLFCHFNILVITNMSLHICSQVGVCGFIVWSAYLECINPWVQSLAL